MDLLCCENYAVPVTRACYRRWDEVPLVWDGHIVEPHFVHLPRPDRRGLGVWAEVALDGILLFERDLSVSRRLVELRRDIAHGRIIRRHIHGQPYWVEAA